MISKNRCHICLEDKINLPSYNKKPCCPSNAYICNSCWDLILENDDINNCPICRSQIMNTNDIEQNLPVIEIRHSRNPTLTNNIKLDNVFCKILIYIFIFVMIGFIEFNLVSFIVLLSFERQNDILFEYIKYPVFWINMLILGSITYWLIYVFIKNRNRNRNNDINTI